jgi:hypothetical protein
VREIIDARFKALLEEGEQLLERVPRDEFGLEMVVGSDDVPDFQAWLSSSANLISAIAVPDTYFAQECQRVVTHEDLKHTVTTSVFQKMLGLLRSAHQEWDAGLLRRVEYIFVASTFDDFLDHAADYHHGGKKMESSVLVSAVLEDTVKKIARKHGLSTSGISLDPLIDELVKIQVITPVKAKRVKSWAGVRNHALHAEWEKFDLKDVGEAVQGTRELIEEFL